MSARRQVWSSELANHRFLIKKKRRLILFYHQNFQKDSLCQEPFWEHNWKDLSSDLDCIKLAAKPNSSVEAFVRSFKWIRIVLINVDG